MRQRLTGKERRRIDIVSRGQRLKGVIHDERKVRVKVRVGVRIRGKVRFRGEDSKRVRVRKSRR